MPSALIRSLAVLIALCGLFSSPALAAENTLRLGASWSPKTMDPQIDGYMFTRLGVVEGLTSLDDNLTILPCLATAWTVSEDKLAWTFALRDGVRFHDGTPLTAPDFRDALQRMLKKGTLMKNVPIASVEAPDDKTLVIRTTEPFAPLPAYLARGEAGALAPASFDQTGGLVKPVGTGPFMVSAWTLKEAITLMPNTSYWGPVKPALDKVVYRSVPDALTRVAMLRGGELDVAQIMPADAAKSLAGSKDFTVFTMPVGRCRMLAFNLSRPPFADIRVREAVNLAVNRQELVDAILDGFGEPAKTLFPPQVTWANNRLQGFAFAPDRARERLAQAGWKDADGDGVLDKDGQPLRIKLVTYPERAELPPMAEVIQQQLRKVGIACDIAVMQVSAAEQARFAGDFDLYLVGRGLLFVPDPDDNLMLDYYSENTVKNGLGAYHYNNPRLDALLLKARQTFDPDARKLLYDEVQALLETDMPAAYLNYYVNIDLVSNRVSGYRMHPTEQTFRLEGVTVH
jgi:peptide/nickel transport system substrate-binding protein